MEDSNLKEIGEITPGLIAGFIADTKQVVTDYGINKELFQSVLTKNGTVSQNPNLHGFVFEKFHEITFNANAEAANSVYRAKNIVPNGAVYGKNSVDIQLRNLNTGNAAGNYQLKCCSTPEAAIRAHSNGNYQGQSFVVAQGQENLVPNGHAQITAPDGTQSNGMTYSQAQAKAKGFQQQGANYSLAQAAKSTAVQMGKAGTVGAAIGITAETLFSYKRYKNGEITGKEYLKEIAKSGGESGITAAATAGIMVPVTGALAAAGLATTAPITIPVTFVVGGLINKVIAPAFGRGDYKKILGEAKYYQNMMHFHDDLVHAIEMTENQFCDFIDEYQRQMLIHAQLSDTNRQLKQLHTVADTQIEQQANQMQNTFGALGDLYNKI